MRRPIFQWHAQAITLWHTPGQAIGGETNAGLDEVLRLMAGAQKRGTPGIEVVDTAEWTQQERWDVYVRHAVGAAWWGYELRRVFGTNSTSGCWPGSQVPLCSIRFAEAEIPMVAPYRDNQLRTGETVSILEVLRMLAPTEQERIFGRTI